MTSAKSNDLRSEEVLKTNGKMNEKNEKEKNKDVRKDDIPKQIQLHKVPLSHLFQVEGQGLNNEANYKEEKKDFKKQTYFVT